MWEQILIRLQDKLVIFCAVLAFFIPYSVNFINRKMHQAGDPPWKRDEE